jgi:hypothetical protein
MEYMYVGKYSIFSHSGLKYGTFSVDSLAVDMITGLFLALFREDFWLKEGIDILLYLTRGPIG